VWLHTDRIKGRLMLLMNMSQMIAFLRPKIKWNSFQGSILSTPEVDLLNSYDKRPVDEQEQTRLLQLRGVELAGAFLRFLSQATSIDHIQYALALVEKIISKPEAVNLFLKNPEPYAAFKAILNREDNYSNTKATKIIATLLVKAPSYSQEFVQEVFLRMSDFLRKEQPRDVLIGLNSLQILLGRNEFRLIFLDTDGINKMGNLLKTHQANVQILYQTLFCLWLMSYNPIVSETFAKTSVIPRIFELIRTVAKEKIIRLGLATLRNLLDKGENNDQMIDPSYIRIIDGLSQKKWGDEDIVNDITALQESLNENLLRMSSFDMYKKEVMSGNLDWTPVHRSEKFWRENIFRFEENSFEVLGILLSLLKTSQNSRVLAVACYDIGEFVRFHPKGRNIIKQLDAKITIMKFMAHQDKEVQKQALLCIQKLMVINWETLESIK